MKIWIKNTSGKPDAILTMALVGFVAVVTKFLVAGVSVEISPGHQFSFGGIDAGSIAAILTPTLGAYVSRRYTDAKHAPQQSAAASMVSKPAVLTEEPRWQKE